MNKWDALSDIFGHSTHGDAIPEYAADNVLIAWPSIKQCINKHLLKRPGSKALDYGCGGGLFCNELHDMGFAVTGYDTSHALVQAATRNTQGKATITHSEKNVASNGNYDLITSIMVFQFIPEIEPIIKRIAALLKPDGLLVFAVFNPDFVDDNAGSAVFDGLGRGETGYMQLKSDIKIPVYNRSDAVYRDMCGKAGLAEIYRDYPEFTEAFLKRYPFPLSTRYAEFLIQGFMSNASSRSE